MSSNIVKVVRGSEVVIPFTWYDSAGNPQSAVGASVTAILRDPWTHETLPPVVSAIFVDIPNGTGEISMDETQTPMVPRGAVSELVVTVVDTTFVTDIFVGAMIEGE